MDKTDQPTTSQSEPFNSRRTTTRTAPPLPNQGDPAPPPYQKTDPKITDKIDDITPTPPRVATPGPSRRPPARAQPRAARPQYAIPRQQTTPLYCLSSERPQLIECPWCDRIAVTQVILESSSDTRAAGAFCCLCCGVSGALIPSLVKWHPDITHICSKCHRTVAYKPNDGGVNVRQPFRSRR
ncbi:hypothetical protein ASPWEDRAFT_588334 [Aspergillus wentii DTO 134E9]|uniref:LITAF domain-containing protein n=1 Tax=Aspergillus wentii DTO 134E9 TaxID=1073089 RepID=A0A1L9RCJ5_ASPWE|nr:uncharacterized protein ASPWEDRAFT_588334 [Aspergillus wentii DTO 134E9]OJJ32632.1 hypothetical protein ASPWEDRAFT_588334 [Aspergillus wentii DTO 134E9]